MGYKILCIYQIYNIKHVIVFGKILFEKQIVNKYNRL